MTLGSSFPLLRTKVHIFLYKTSKCCEKNLSTEDTEGTDHREFLVASLEILEEIFVKMLLTQEKIYHSASINIIFN